MPFRNYNVDVSQTATKLYEHEAGDVEVWIRSSGFDVFGGDDQVSFANGMEFNFPVLPDSGNEGSGGYIFHTQVNPADKLWAVRTLATGTSAVRVLVRKE